MSRSRALVVGLSLCAPLAAAAEAVAQESSTPVRAFRTFTREAASRGLPQSTVVALHEDAQGVVWIATMGGVAKVERGVVERLRPLPNAPTAEPFNAFASRSRGGLHVAGTAGLYTWTGSEWHHADTPAAMMALAEGAGGRLYGITTTGMTYVRDTDEAPWVAVTGVQDFDFDTLAIRADGGVLAGGQRGVVLLDGAGLGAPVCNQPVSRVRVIRVDSGGTVWAGGEDGSLSYCAVGAGSWQSVPLAGWNGGRIRAMAIDRRQRVWVGGDRGFVAFGRAGRPFTLWSPDNGVTAATVTSMVSDRTGGMWFGFNGAGLQQWVGESWSHRTFWMEPGDTSSMFAFSVTARPSGGFLATVFSRGILAWDGARMRAFGRGEGITEDLRFAVEPEPGVIWAGGRQAIFESTDGHSFRKVHTMPVGFVNGFFPSPSGEWWAATSNAGILRREGGRWVPHDRVNAQLDDVHVRHIVWRRNGEIWFATTRGVTVLRGDGFDRVSLALPEGLTAAYAIVEAGDREMWVAGAGGVAIGDGARWRLLTVQDGLAGSTAYSVARAGDGSMWVGGSEGIAHRLPSGQWRQFDISNGLISEETNSHGLLLMPDGGVLFGTMSGLARYEVDAAAPADPPLQSFWRGTVAASPTHTITVPADSRRLHLEWVAPWPRPSAVEYRTRIERLRDEWSESQTTSELRLENLSAGRFTVEVQSRLPGSASWTPSLTATVVVEPRWWETPFAQAAAGLIVIGAIVGLVQWRTRRLRRRAEELEEAIEDAMANVKVLRGLLPICAHCKKIRDDGGHWSRLEEYIGRHSEADFSHGLCPDCQQTHYPELTSD